MLEAMVVITKKNIRVETKLKDMKNNEKTSKSINCNS